MLNLIVGNKGSGKTKRMIDMINESLKISKGNIVCIEKGMKLTYDISHKVRLVEVESYDVSGYDTFYGFVSGMLAGNYDISEIYIDGIFKIGGRDYEKFSEFVAKLDTLATGHNDLKVVMTVSCDESELAPELKKYFC